MYTHDTPCFSDTKNYNFIDLFKMLSDSFHSMGVDFRTWLNMLLT